MKQKIVLPADTAMFSAKTAGQTSSFTERYYIERIRKGEIPIVRIGRSVRILRQDLQDFLDKKIKEGEEADENENATGEIAHVEPKVVKTKPFHTRRRRNIKVTPEIE